MLHDREKYYRGYGMGSIKATEREILQSLVEPERGWLSRGDIHKGDFPSKEIEKEYRSKRYFAADFDEGWKSIISCSTFY